VVGSSTTPDQHLVMTASPARAYATSIRLVSGPG
jgi:hypothetical protein